MANYYYACHSCSRKLLNKIDNVLSTCDVTTALSSVVYKKYRTPYIEIVKTGLFKKQIYKSEGCLDSFRLIFEEVNDELVEIITGRRFPKYDENKELNNTELYFYPTEKVESKEVVEILKSLTDEDLNRIKNALNKVDEILNEHKQLIEYDKSQEEVNNQFIKQFRIAHNGK